MTRSFQNQPSVTVRPMQLDEYPFVVEYFHGAPDELLLRMGVERRLLPPRRRWLEQLRADHTRGPGEAERIWLCWLHDAEAVGHSSLSEIVPGDHAHIHLHMWRPLDRRHGLGARLFHLSATYAFEHLDLARLYCEPKADNPAPNRVLGKLGFRLIETRWGNPGSITFEQQTNLYVLERSEHDSG